MRRTDNKGGGEERLNCPSGICIDYNGGVYVADCDNNTISIFSRDLKFLNYLATQQLKYPRDVKVTPLNVVVVDKSLN